MPSLNADLGYFDKCIKPSCPLSTIIA